MPSSVPLSISVICLPTEPPRLLSATDYWYIVALTSRVSSPAGALSSPVLSGTCPRWSGVEDRAHAVQQLQCLEGFGQQANSLINDAL